MAWKGAPTSRVSGKVSTPTTEDAALKDAPRDTTQLSSTCNRKRPAPRSPEPSSASSKTRRAGTREEPLRVPSSPTSFATGRTTGIHKVGEALGLVRDELLAKVSSDDGNNDPDDKDTVVVPSIIPSSSTIPLAPFRFPPGWTAINQGRQLTWDEGEDDQDKDDGSRPKNVTRRRPDLRPKRRTPVRREAFAPRTLGFKTPGSVTKTGDGVVWNQIVDPLRRYDAVLNMQIGRRAKAQMLAEEAAKRERREGGRGGATSREARRSKIPVSSSSSSAVSG